MASRHGNYYDTYNSYQNKTNETDLSNSLYQFCNVKYASSGWINRMTRRSIVYYSEFEPWESIRDISPIPLLMIIARHDTVTSSEDEIDAFEKYAMEPKRLVLVEGGHFSFYNTDEDAFQIAVDEALQWFVKYLK